MKQLFLVCTLLVSGSSVVLAADAGPPVFRNAPPPPAPAAPAEEPIPASTPAPPAAAGRSAAELEKLAAPIALFPDPLVAAMLPASAYPLQIVLAARFVANTNNLSKVDAQPWDENVKAVARVPAAIQKMEQDLTWTVELGNAFVEQPKELMDAIQKLRGRAISAGSLKTTPQQTVTVTNGVVETLSGQQVTYVTNSVVQIVPADPQVVYVPQYNPAVVYDPYPFYVDPFYPLVTFGAGIAIGAFFNHYHCDWYYGGVGYWGGGGHGYYHGGGHAYYHHSPSHGSRPPPAYRPPPGSPRPPSGARPPASPPRGTSVSSARPPAPSPGGRTAPSTSTSSQRWQPNRNSGIFAMPTSQQPKTQPAQSRVWGSSAPSAANRYTPGAGNSAARVTPGSVPSFGRGAVSRPSFGSSSASRPSSPSRMSSPGGNSGGRGSFSRGGGSGSFGGRGGSFSGGRGGGGR